MYACMYVCMHVCTYVRMYVLYVWCGHTNACMECDYECVNPNQKYYSNCLRYGKKTHQIHSSPQKMAKVNMA